MGAAKTQCVGANRFGLHRSLCGFAADRDRRPPFRAWAVFRSLFGAGKWGAGRRTALAPHLSCKICVFALAVEGLVLRTCTPILAVLCVPLCPFVVLRVLRECRAAFGFIAAKGGRPGLNLRGSSKLPSLPKHKCPG